ncbi:hypothetical protein D3C84_191970 [compost metagenome]
MADARRHGAQRRQFAGLHQVILGAHQFLLRVFALQHFLLEAPVEAFQVAGPLGDPGFQFSAGLGFEVDALQVVTSTLHQQPQQQHQHQQRRTTDGDYRAHRAIDQGSGRKNADAPAGFVDPLSLGQPGVGVEVQWLGIAGRVGLHRSDRQALLFSERASGAKAPIGSRGENDHAVMVGQQQLFRGFTPQAFGVVQVDLDH